MTAVEWLQNELNTKGKITPVDFYQANKMFEQQMIDSFIEGHNVCRCVTDNTDEAKECFDEWFKNLRGQSEQLPICKCENTERIEVGSGSWNIHCKDCGKNW